MDYIAIENKIKRLKELYPTCTVSYDILISEVVYNVSGPDIELCSYSKMVGKYQMENGLYNQKKTIK